MRIKAFQNFSLGKLGTKNKKADSTDDENSDVQIAEIDTKANGKAKGQKVITIDDKPLSESEIPIPVDEPPIRPHGPAAELTLEDSKQDEENPSLDVIEDNDSIKLGENENAIKTNEIKVEAAKIKVEASALPVEGAAPAEEEKKEEKAADTDSLNNLFSQEEDEENPLDSLINSLPDVTVQELMEDLAEIHRIINEWKPGVH